MHSHSLGLCLTVTEEQSVDAMSPNDDQYPGCYGPVCKGAGSSMTCNGVMGCCFTGSMNANNCEVTCSEPQTGYCAVGPNGGELLDAAGTTGLRGGELITGEVSKELFDGAITQGADDDGYGLCHNNQQEYCCYEESNWDLGIASSGTKSFDTIVRECYTQCLVMLSPNPSV